MPLSKRKDRVTTVPVSALVVVASADFVRNGQHIGPWPV